LSTIITYGKASIEIIVITCKTVLIYVWLTYRKLSNPESKYV